MEMDEHNWVRPVDVVLTAGLITGEFFFAPYLIPITLNAGINVWTHASSTHNIGQFGQFYCIGAASAAIAIYGAPILGPATPYIAASFQASADDYVSNGINWV